MVAGVAGASGRTRVLPVERVRYRYVRESVTILLQRLMEKTVTELTLK